jgi:hypothetical protein
LEITENGEVVLRAGTTEPAGCIAYQDHPIIVFDPAAHRRGHANASCHARNDTRLDAQIAQDRIEGRARREAAKAFLDDEMLAFLRLQLVKDLR